MAMEMERIKRIAVLLGMALRKKDVVSVLSREDVSTA